MANPGDVLQQRVSAVLDIAARIPGGLPGLTAARDDDLVELVSATQQGMLVLQGVLAAVSGEISRRSSGAGDASLAKRLGYRSARGLIAAKAGIGFGEASRTVDVGEAIRPRVALSGEDLPSERPHIADAVLAGLLPLPVAQLIDGTVEKVEGRMLLDEAGRLERTLVNDFLSRQYTVAAFTRYSDQVVDLLDPDGTKPRDDALRAEATIRETQLSNGMLRVVMELDPESAAYYRAAIRAKTNPRRPDGDEPADGAGTTQGPSNVSDIGSRRGRTQPTPMQSKVAAFIRIVRDSLKAEAGTQAGVDTTILVRIDLEALLTGIGSATIDGISKPIPASAARRMAAEADLIPQVLSGKSQLLDQGESRRVFTKAQRYAILSAYSGCVFPNCDIPSSMVEIHHIHGWATRHDHRHGTDLQNGIPLCGFHNRLMEGGWELRFDDDRVPWFVPPASVDRFRAPVRGGNLVGRRAA